MRFDIKNMAMLSVLILSSCAVQEDLLSTKAETKKNHQNSQSKAQKNFVGAKSTLTNVLIFQQGPKLEAVNINDGTAYVLRDSFLQDKLGGIYGSWSVSPNGSSIAFTTTPDDVDFFSAGAVREYLFTAPFNGKQMVLLAAYGSRAVKQDYSFDSPSWSADGKRLVVSQASRTVDIPNPREVAIYDVNTRKEIWSSRSFDSKLPLSGQYEQINLYYPSLSPDGQDIVCFAKREPNDGTALELSVGQQAPPTWIIRFGLKEKALKVLATLNDQFSTGRLNKTTHEFNSTWGANIRQLRPDFAWHPTQKKFLFVGPISPKSPTVNLFIFDLQSKKMTRFSNANQSDTSPQWSPDGKSVFWLRDGQIFRANADGTHAERILPQVAGMTRIQLLPKIADWSRYRKLAIEPLAGKDK